MIGYPDDPTAFAHARSLARLGGLDLTLAVFDGWLRRDELAAIVATCHDCTAGYPCETAARSGGPFAVLPGCANAGPLGGLTAPA
jgi:Family of unknown function (DUF6455)